MLIGANGQGKTNVVESLIYLSTASSHRVSKDVPLIRAGHNSALVGADVVWLDRSQRVELEINAKGTNRARIAGAARRPRDLLGILRTVMFAPEDLQLVRGDPADRRRFLDTLVVALNPRHLSQYRDLERVVKQRNALLKTWHTTRDRVGFQATLQVWNDQLVDIATRILQARIAVLSQLAQPLATAYTQVADTPEQFTAQAHYQANWWSEISSEDIVTASPSQLREVLAAAISLRQRVELERGLTMVGPQRDDIELLINQLPAKGYASHGESWSLALALRLASFTMLRESFDTGGDPVLILDDVFAELDVGRRNRLATLVADCEQVLVTAAVLEDVPSILRQQILTVTRDETSHIA